MGGEPGRVTFDLDSDDVIKQFMSENPNRSNPFIELSGILKQYTAKQICNRWHNYLDPRFNHDPFSDNEKKYIYDWAVRNRRSNNKIPWKNCQEAMRADFGKVFSCSRIKNVYYSKTRSIQRKRIERVGRAPAFNTQFTKVENEVKTSAQVVFPITSVYETENKAGTPSHNEAGSSTRIAIQSLMNDDIITPVCEVENEAGTFSRITFSANNEAGSSTRITIQSLMNDDIITPAYEAENEARASSQITFSANNEAGSSTRITIQSLMNDEVESEARTSSQITFSANNEAGSSTRITIQSLMNEE